MNEHPAPTIEFAGGPAPSERGHPYLGDDEVRWARQAWADGQTQSAIARALGVSQPAIWALVHKRTYRDVAPEPDGHRPVAAEPEGCET